MVSSRQEYWIGLPFPPPGDLPDPGIEPMSLASPALAGMFFTSSATWEATEYIYMCMYITFVFYIYIYIYTHTHTSSTLLMTYEYISQLSVQILEVMILVEEQSYLCPYLSGSLRHFTSCKYFIHFLITTKKHCQDCVSIPN